MSLSFFWTIPRLHEFSVCRLFGTLCMFHLHRCSETSAHIKFIRQGSPKKKETIQQTLFYLKLEECGAYSYHCNMKGLAVLRDYVQSRQHLDLNHTSKHQDFPQIRAIAQRIAYTHCHIQYSPLLFNVSI